MQRASSIACAVHAACWSRPASSDDQPNSETITGTPASRARGGHVEQVDAVERIAHGQRRAPHGIRVDPEEVHRHAVGAQPGGPGGRIAARVAVAREIACDDLAAGLAACTAAYTARAIGS